jgi:outer membrane biosynthesis protein TonB
MSTTVRATASSIVMAAVLALTVSGCARPKPAVVTAPPALEVPVVPPRVVATLPEEQPPEEAAPAQPEKPRANRPARPRPRPAQEPAVQKPEAPQEPAPEAQKPAEQPQTVVRTPQTADEPEASRRVRAALGRATDQLARVNLGALGADARSQYDTARRFIDQAEGALRARNYMFAAYLADKAETLARGLVGR